MLRNRTCPHQHHLESGKTSATRHALLSCPHQPLRPVPRPLARPLLPLAPVQPLAPAPAIQHSPKPLPLPLCATTANGATVAPPPSSPSHISFDPQQRARSRKARLSKLLELRSIYRNYVRAKTLLDLPSPVYRPAEEHEAPPAVQGEPSEGLDPQRMSYEEFQEQERLKEAVDAVAEMMLVAEQIKIGLRTLPVGFGEVITVDGQPAAVEEAENLVRARGKEFVQQLQARVAEEMPKLPFGSETAAQTALDTQKARSIKQAQQMGDFEAFQLGANEGSAATGDKESDKAARTGEGEGSGSSSEKDKGSANPGGLVLPGQDAALQLERGIEQLAQAEKVAGKFVATRLKPVLRKAQNAEVGDIVRGTGSYLQGLWTRLNGRGSNEREPALSPDLPLPRSNSAKDSELVISQLSLNLDDLAKRLREAGRTRENKLKQAKAPEGRVTMPFLLKSMDEEVLRLSRELALRTLQLEMEYAYRALEDEAMDLVGFDVKDVMNRQGSTAELRLLAAEFAYLDEQLAGLASQASGGVPTVSVSTVDANGNAISGDSRGGMSSSLVMEDLLASLANDIPDMRQRVGVPDQVVFGGQGFSFTKTRLQIQEAFEAVLEAVMFLVRGLKLLTSDVTNSGRRFWRAAMGATLKPREVSALKRTARDLLAFIPFTIILIIPITPLGHVLVFGFIQQYFPQFFPSCFTTKRQEIMVRYEELEKQLLAARAQAEAAEEEAELAQAAAAVARLTAPENAGTSSTAPAGAAAKAGAAQGAGSSMSGSARGVKGSGGSRQGQGMAGQQQQNGQPTQEAQPQAAVQQPQQQPQQPQQPLPQRPPQQHNVQGDANGNGRASAASVSVDDATNEVVAQTAQVRALEQQVAQMYDDVTLGDMDGAELTEVKQKEKSNLLRKRSSRKNSS